MDERLIGTWRLISTVTEDLETGVKSDTWGGQPAGFINYAPDGRMMVINTGGERRKPAGTVPTDAESAALFRSMLAYAGTYSVNGNEVTHTVDISWNEAWTGSKQVRLATFEGSRVRLSTKPTPDPVSGRMSVRTITWEKI